MNRIISNYFKKKKLLNILKFSVDIKFNIQVRNIRAISLDYHRLGIISKKTYLIYAI